MSDDLTTPQADSAALGTPVYNYAPPSHVNTNQQLLDPAAIQRAIEDAVNARLAQAGVTPPAPPKSPQEAARDKLANAGAGLGIEERLKEVYELLAHIAQKVGL